jgi:HTH-type transcriptional regulator/antitoxin HigA
MNAADEARTPGQLIRALLDARGWSQKVLAIVLGIDESVITRIAADKRELGAELALALGEVFDVPPERFLNLQTEYTLAMAKITARADPARATRARLFGDLPINEMIRRGWLDATDIRDTRAVERALTTFFGVGSADEIEILPHAPKKTHVSTPATAAQLAWIYRVRQIAEEMLVPRYSPSAVRGAIPKLKQLLLAAEEARKVPRILAESGIRFVIVESLAGAKIDGVTLWLDDLSPVIGMSLRYDRLDNFWFVLRHEIEHVINRDGVVAAMLDTELEGGKAGNDASLPDEERKANEAAADFLVPRKSMQSFISRKAPFFAERDILGFARTLKIHPALVAGQLQHHTARYDRFRDHQVKVRSIVTPGAMVDGWGDVAPVGI